VLRARSNLLDLHPNMLSRGGPARVLRARPAAQGVDLTRLLLVGAAAPIFVVVSVVLMVWLGLSAIRWLGAGG
jgi:hypothetical protein